MKTEFEDTYLGIDIGSVTISLALLNAQKDVIKTDYQFHAGQIAEKLTSILLGFNLAQTKGVAITSSTPSYIKSTKQYDNRISFITAAKQMYSDVGSILMVGGEKFGLVMFDDTQQYRKYKSNSSCAAGTGSFLDQQTKRLNLKSIAAFNELAFSNRGEFPKIASRCSVFAKTDLIHAQQEGYTLSEICDGLCYGLAKNIVDTLFSSNTVKQPMVFVGGVSQNKAVVKHIEKLTGIKLVISKYSHLFGAIGAAVNLINEKVEYPAFKYNSVNDIIFKESKNKKYTHKALKLELSNYPDFTSFKKYNFNSQIIINAAHVEVDIYRPLIQNKYSVYLGVDIGSTSTKAIFIDSDKNVLAGFYTRTAGQPVQAVQCLFEAVNSIELEKNIKFNVIGVGTTGSGRKFIGRIIGADIIPDEISAHARAATELDSDVDTIIEIGGQDAKFTTLSNGRVTFSIMNNVCAAGTGSFIEEQAKKLGVSLDEYSQRAENVAAPMSSDRCTVFMERDLNHYINENYNTNEILASVLHSVRENYLTKVAIEKNIGSKIFFQGATAKNRALVAAFEQKLKKPIMISKYCHLTGAYGIALELFDKKFKASKFRGIKLYKQNIVVKTEVCDLCTNHCKYKIAEVDGETEVYGFLCGRDFNSEKFIENNTAEFDLVKAYNQQFRFKAQSKVNSKIVVGIPAGLYLFNDLFLWQRFFDLLDINTITSSNFNGAVKSGKSISGAEFCAPMVAIQGHVKYLMNKSDYIFLPTYLEDKSKQKNQRRQYCYYSQYAAPVVTSVEELDNKKMLINPLVNALQSDASFYMELYSSFKKVGLRGFSIARIIKAYNLAKQEQALKKREWKGQFKLLSTNDKNLNVVLLGRPYTILSKAMNNNIPNIFVKNGVKTFFQDMVDFNEEDVEGINEILSATHWKYAAAILACAEHIAHTKNLYPVFITSFKCSPDSFIIEYFKQILDMHKKPYLVLQLDEHDSNVGYETRIEAALRSFENHFHIQKEASNLKTDYLHSNVITNSNELKGKTLLMPSIGEYASQLIEANLRRNGINAHTLYDTEDSIKKSLGSNTGQCLPLNIIIQNALDYIEENNLDPSNTVIWMLDAPISCNLGMFINYMEKLLKEQNKNLQKVKMYTGQISFVDFSIITSINSYLAFLFGGYIRKIECRLRPYEKQAGQTDAVVKKSMQLLCKTFENGASKEDALKQVINWFKQIEVDYKPRPKVAIFGDLYARDNDVFNQNLIRFIEANGGEVITTPYSEYIKIITLPYNSRLLKEGFYMTVAMRRFLLAVSSAIEEKYLKYFNQILHEPIAKPLRYFKDKLELFNIKPSHNGESLDNVLKILHLTEQYPDISLFVQTNPSYCCPSLVTEAMTSKMEKLLGKPIISIEYDGTSSGKNEDIIPFLKYAK